MGSDESPTTAIVLYWRKISAMGSEPGATPSGSSSFMSASRGFFRRGLRAPAHGREQLVIFLSRAHGNANRVRKSHPPERPHDHTFLQQLVVQAGSPRTNVDENKVRVTPRHTQPKSRKFLEQPRALRGIRLDRALHVLRVVQ